MTPNQALLTVLTRIRDNGPMLLSVGICHNVHSTEEYQQSSLDGMRAINGKMRELFKSWPKYSGDYAFPIPCEGMTPALAYHDHTHVLWFPGCTYGQARRELLHHMIEELEKEVD